MQRLGRILAAVAVVGLLVTCIGAAAEADSPSPDSSPPAGCDPLKGTCEVSATPPPSPGSTSTNEPSKGGAGGATQCHASTGKVIDCYDPDLGWLNPDDKCYYKPVKPAPPATDPRWDGHYPDGAI
jgi:hypothetical protein